MSYTVNKKLPLLIICVLLVAFFFKTVDVHAAITSPLDITGSNLKLWLDASDVDGDGVGANNPSDGAAITTWVDKSGNSKNATQSTTANKPTYAVGTLNSKPTIRFAGSTPPQYMTSGSTNDWSFLGDRTGASVFIVGRSLATTTTNFFLTTDEGARGFSLLYLGNADTSIAGFSVWLSGLFKDFSHIDAQTSYNVHSIILPTSSPVLQHYVNTGVLGTVTRYPDAGNISSSSALTIGARYNNTYGLNGDIAEIVIFNRALNTTERKDMECYLQVKWGLSTYSCAGDVTPPSLESFTSTSTNSEYGVGQPVNISATFSEPVALGSSITVTLNTGRSVVLNKQIQNTVYGSYVPNIGESTNDLDVSAITAGSVSDVSGNTTTSFTLPTGAQTLAYQKAISIETGLPTVPVIIIAGQSNALGRAPLGSISRSDGTPRSNIYDQSLASFQTLQQGVNQHTTSPATQFGPEMGIAYTHKDQTTTGNLYLVKITEGNTFLEPYGNYNDWYPYNEGKLFDKLITKSQSAFTQLHTLGYTPDVRGVYWMQGENDGIFESYANLYATNLTNLITEIRSRLGFSELPVIIGKVRQEDPSAPYASIVRTAQQSVVTTGVNTCIMDGDDLTLFDNVHFDAAGQMIIGKRVWNAAKDCSHTSPVLTAKTVNGSTVTLTFDKNLDTESIPATNVFVVSVNNGASETISNIQITGSQITFTIGTTLTPSDTATLTYTVPGSNKIQDWSRNTFAAISTPLALTNTTADTTAPTITSVTTSTPSGTYGPGDAISITVAFSEPVTSSGLVTVLLQNGGSCTFTITNATSGSCSYVISQGQATAALAASAVSGTVQDQSSNALTNFTIPINISSGATITITTPQTVSSGGGGGGGSTRTPVSQTSKPVQCLPVPQKSLGLGLRNKKEDVVMLQTFLRDKAGYPDQLVTGYFGQITKKNVKLFQQQYAKDILYPAGLRFPTGFVGTRTLEKIRSLSCEKI